MERIKKDYGAVLMQDGKIIGYEVENTGQGFVFKDYEAFRTGKGICYISEHEFEDLEEELQSLRQMYGEDYLQIPEYLEDANHILESVGWTREKLINLAGGPGFEELALDVLKAVDWQTPETYFNESEIDELDLERYHLTKEQVNKAWGYQYFEV